MKLKLLTLISILSVACGCEGTITAEEIKTVKQQYANKSVYELCLNGVVYYESRTYMGSYVYTPKVDSQTLTFIRCVN